MKSKIINPKLMWVIIIAGFVMINIILPKEQYLFDNNISRYLLIFGVVYFAYFLINAVLTHKEFIRSAERISKIVKKGVYGIVRHPIYSGDIMLGWSIFFYRPSIRMLVCIIWMTIFLISWMKLEENALIERFGEEYKQYKKEVPMFLPFLKKLH